MECKMEKEMVMTDELMEAIRVVEPTLFSRVAFERKARAYRVLNDLICEVNSFEPIHSLLLDKTKDVIKESMDKDIELFVEVVAKSNVVTGDKYLDNLATCFEYLVNIGELPNDRHYKEYAECWNVVEEATREISMEVLFGENGKADKKSAQKIIDKAKAIKNGRMEYYSQCGETMEALNNI